MRRLLLMSVALPCALPGLLAAAGPRVIERIAADYTEEARIARLEGSSLVTLVVDDDGTLRDVHVTRPIGLGLDKNAIAAVKQWQFAPATEDERPVRAVARVEVNFRLLTSREDWYLSRASFDTPVDASRPLIRSAPYPERDKSAGPASVTISFQIDEQGVPDGFHVDKSSGGEAAAQVTRFLRNWRFQPATRDGHAVRAACTLAFSSGPVLPGD